MNNPSFFICATFLYLSVLNIVSFCLFALDKYKSKRNKWRIRESTLMMSGILGGSFGGMLAMRIFHHKTKHLKFTVSFPVIFILQCIFLICLYKK